MDLSSLSLPAELQEFVQNKVDSGMYPTEHEVVREALRLLRERDRVREIRLTELRKEIQLGLDEADRGEVAPLDIEDIKAEGRRRVAEQGKND